MLKEERVVISLFLIFLIFLHSEYNAQKNYFYELSIVFVGDHTTPVVVLPKHLNRINYK